MGMVLIEPKVVGTEAGVASVEGSVGNAASVVDTVVALMYRRHIRHANLPGLSPSENKCRSAMSNNSNFPFPSRRISFLNRSSFLPCEFAAKGVIRGSQKVGVDWNHTRELVGGRCVWYRAGPTHWLSEKMEIGLGFLLLC